MGAKAKDLMSQNIPEVSMQQKAAAHSPSLPLDQPQLLLHPIARNPKPERHKELGRGLHNFEIVILSLILGCV